MIKQPSRDILTLSNTTHPSEHIQDNSRVIECCFASCLPINSQTKPHNAHKHVKTQRALHTEPETKLHWKSRDSVKIPTTPATNKHVMRSVKYYPHTDTQNDLRRELPGSYSGHPSNTPGA